jgi:hypothetical protein
MDTGVFLPFRPDGSNGSRVEANCASSDAHERHRLVAPAPLKRPHAHVEPRRHLLDREELAACSHRRSFCVVLQVLVIARVSRGYLRVITSFGWIVVVICHQLVCEMGADAGRRHLRELGVALDQERAPARELGRLARRAAAREGIDEDASRRHERADQVGHQLHRLARGMPVRVACLRHEEEPVVLTEHRLGEEGGCRPSAVLRVIGRAFGGVVVEALFVDTASAPTVEPQCVDAGRVLRVGIVEVGEPALVEVQWRAFARHARDHNGCNRGLESAGRRRSARGEDPRGHAVDHEPCVLDGDAKPVEGSLGADRDERRAGFERAPQGAPQRDGRRYVPWLLQDAVWRVADRGVERGRRHVREDVDGVAVHDAHDLCGGLRLGGRACGGRVTGHARLRRRSSPAMPASLRVADLELDRRRDAIDLYCGSSRTYVVTFLQKDAVIGVKSSK